MAAEAPPPTRFIFSDVDLAHFKESTAKKELLRLVGAMGKSCAKSDLEYNPEEPLVGMSPAMASLHGSLRQMETWLVDIPPDRSVQARFGNPSFRAWHARLTERSSSIISCLLACSQTHGASESYDTTVLQECSEQGFTAAQETAEEQNATVKELTAYWLDAFGHPVRLDYGTGHESSFQIFLFALLKLGCYGNEPVNPPSMDRLKAVCLGIFSQYLKVTRGLQTDYMLEPAGSHGVWGLDDYHCLPFYFGACQLSRESDFTPSSIHSASATDAERFMYFGCIQYIKQLKKGVPFFECSPMLNDISHLPTWTKVSAGLLKLYEGEVLHKRPVVQHFVFGRLFPGTYSGNFCLA